MTDELATVLSKIPGLRVASRTSSYSFKGKQVNVADIGHALNVQRFSKEVCVVRVASCA
jgi:TolB-like protein